MNNYKTIAFFSGFPDRRFTDEIAERLGKGLPVRRCIAFITARPADYQQNDEDSAGMHGMFVEYGIGFDRFCVVDARMEPADAQRWAREADCFFLMGGGVCAEQMQLMRDKGIYIFRYRAFRNVPIFSIFPSLTSFPSTLSTVVMLISGNRPAISSLDTGT